MTYTWHYWLIALSLLIAVSPLPLLPSQLNKSVDTQAVLEREGRGKANAAIQFDKKQRTKTL